MIFRSRCHGDGIGNRSSVEVCLSGWDNVGRLTRRNSFANSRAMYHVRGGCVDVSRTIQHVGGRCATVGRGV